MRASPETTPPPVFITPTENLAKARPSDYYSVFAPHGPVDLPKANRARSQDATAE